MGFEESTFRLAGGSEPVDAYDGFCRQYHEGMVCAKIDNPDCDPINIAYNTFFDVGSLNSVDIETSCTEANPDDQCAANVCTVENVFMLNVLEYLSNTGDITRWELYHHVKATDNGLRN